MNVSTSQRLPDLPVRAVLPELTAALQRNDPVILQAPPGSGKTTLAPLALMDAAWLRGRRIVLLEPRRLAARAACRRMAALLQEPVGERIGYQIRLERRISAQTRVEVLTEGLLVQRLLRDPEIGDVGLVIFDEFHERALVADHALAMTLEVRRALRPDLRLLVMSATLDAETLAAQLALPGAPGTPQILRAAARLWPVETRLVARMPVAPLPQLAADAVQRALREETGSLLVFLPGEGEIRRTAELLAAAQLPAGCEVCPLYAALPAVAQERAIAPTPPGHRKVVLATAIAESSLTIEGVRVVIDGGWMRVARYSVRNGMSRLLTLRVSRDRAAQRRGRAGRLEPGVCYCLWDEAVNRTLPEQAQPEILDADLAAVVLQCADWGTAARTALPWPTPPPAAAWQRAVDLLCELGALTPSAVGATPRITAHGRALAGLPLHPRLAHMILRAAAAGCAAQAALLAAVVAEVPEAAALRRCSDIRTLLERLDAPAAAEAEFARRVRTLARQWSRRFAADHRKYEPGRLCAWAYPDHIARRRGADGRYLLASGAGARLDPADPLARSEWLVAIELTDDAADATIRLAAPYERDWLEEDFGDQIVVQPIIAWDKRSEAVTAASRSRYGAIVLREAGMAQPEAAALRRAFFSGLRDKGVTQLPWMPAATELRARATFLHNTCPDEGWPAMDDETLTTELETWLGPFVEGFTRWSQMAGVDLAAAVLARLGPLRRRLDTMAPTHFTVPSGSRIRIRYDAGATPVLAARIQEVFGLAATPRLAGGRVAVLLHLLSPAQRPVQVTSDLASFWHSGYAAVRKELRGRYPKHYWPENPATATPTRGVRPPV